MSDDTRQNRTLTPKQHDALVLLLDGETRIATAERAGISRSTLYDWLSDGHPFRLAYEEACDRAVTEARSVLKAGAVKAAQALVGVAVSGVSSDGPRVAAAKAVLDRIGVPEETRSSVAVSTDAAMLDAVQAMVSERGADGAIEALEAMAGE